MRSSGLSAPTVTRGRWDAQLGPHASLPWQLWPRRVRTPHQRCSHPRGCSFSSGCWFHGRESLCQAGCTAAPTASLCIGPDPASPAPHALLFKVGAGITKWATSYHNGVGEPSHFDHNVARGGMSIPQMYCWHSSDRNSFFKGLGWDSC